MQGQDIRLFSSQICKKERKKKVKVFWNVFTFSKNVSHIRITNLELQVNLVQMAYDITYYSE